MSDLIGALVRFTLPTRPVVGVVTEHTEDGLTVRAVGSTALHLIPEEHAQVIDLPELDGDVYGRGGPNEFDGRVRLYTVAHLPFDTLGGRRPAKVTLGGRDRWSVSYTAKRDTGMWVLNVYRLDKRKNIEAHDLDGSTWPTQSAAEEAAYNHGLTGFMVYEKDAAALGLPAPELETVAAA